MVHPPFVYRLARAKPKFFIYFCYMVPHCLKIAIQTLYETENMANTGPLYRLFQLSTHFLQIEGNGKEGKVHEDLILSKMAETFVIHIVFHLSEHGFRFYASLSSVFQPFLGAELLFGFLPVFSEPVIQFYRPVSFCFKTTAS